MNAQQRWMAVVGVVGGAFLVQAVMLACGGMKGSGNPDGGLAHADASADVDAPSVVPPTVVPPMPSGSIVAFAGKTVPDGWLLCDGSVISRSNYAPLYAVIGDAWGTGDSTTTFNLPDLRGVFLRGVDAGANRDPDAAARIAIAPGGNVGGAVGTLQADVFRSHDHGGHTAAVTPTGGTNAAFDESNTNGGPPGFRYIGVGNPSNLFYDHTHPINAQGGHETRPINAAVNYIIKL